VKKRLITAADVRRFKETGELRVVVSKGDLVTPLALDAARELGVEFCYETVEPLDLPPWSGAAQNARRQAARSPQAATPSPAGPSLKAKVPPEELETRVRRLVAAMVGVPSSAATSPGVRHVAGRGLQLKPFPFDVGHPEMDIRLLDVVTSADGAPIAGGFMSFHKGSFPWTLDYDEIEYVLEGELHIGTPQETTIGLPGDVLYVPKGTHITFGTPDWVKFFYVTYPAEWRG